MTLKKNNSHTGGILGDQAENKQHSATKYLEMGKAEVNDHYKAIEYFSKAIELDPNIADAYSFRGFEKQILNDFNGAINDYGMAIRLNPKDYGAFFNRGSIKLHKNDNLGHFWTLKMR